MRIVVASGKGGTGKTTLATSLALWLAERGGDVVYADADVEEPNGHLFLRPSGVEETVVTVLVPRLPEGRCSGCGLCQQLCAFNAIVALPADVMVLDNLCHGCGACVLACPDKALVELPRRIGVLRRGRTGPLEVVWGVLDVGEARAEPVVDALLRSIRPEALVVVDAAPGAACVAAAAMRAGDHVVLVTEPTPMGLHDLGVAIALLESTGRRASVVVNRSDLGAAPVDRLLRSKGVPVLARIPFDEGLARAYAEGGRLTEASPALRTAVGHIGETVLRDFARGTGAP